MDWTMECERKRKELRVTHKVWLEHLENVASALHGFCLKCALDVHVEGLIRISRDV